MIHSLQNNDKVDDFTEKKKNNSIIWNLPSQIAKYIRRLSASRHFQAQTNLVFIFLHIKAVSFNKPFSNIVV